MASLFSDIAVSVGGKSSTGADESNKDAAEASAAETIGGAGGNASTEGKDTRAPGKQRPVGLWTAGPKPVNAAAFAAARGCATPVDTHQLAFEL